MVGTHLTPTAVLSNKNRGSEKEAIEVQVGREERLPPPHRNCRGESRLACLRKDTPAQGQGRAAVWRCKDRREHNSPKGRQGSCPDFKSLWDSWRDCSQLQPKQHLLCPCSEPSWNEPSSVCKLSGCLPAGWAKSSHQLMLTPLLDSNWFMHSQYRAAEVFLRLGARMYFVAAENYSQSGLEPKGCTGDLKLPSSQIHCKNFGLCTRLFGFAIK